MSVRAYKIIEIRHESTPTFNCWHDQHIVELGDMNGDILTLQREAIEQRINELKDDILSGKIYLDAHNGDTSSEKNEENRNQEKTEDALKILEDILKDMREGDEDGDWVEYYCY